MASRLVFALVYLLIIGAGAAAIAGMILLTADDERHGLPGHLLAVPVQLEMRDRYERAFGVDPPFPLCNTLPDWVVSVNPSPGDTLVPCYVEAE